MGLGHFDEIRRPRQHVSRSRLVAELMDSPLGVIEAAAGYGKSVLAAEYQAALGVACAWVCLGPPDDDASVLISSMRRAFRAARLSDLYSALEDGDPQRWPDRFLDALAGLADPLLIVLDDIHHLRGPDTAALVLRIAKGISLPHRLLVAGRRIPAHLDLPGGVVGATSIGVQDLAFDVAEAAELASGVLGRAASDREVRALLEATGGWASALALGVRAMHADGHGAGGHGAGGHGADGHGSDGHGSDGHGGDGGSGDGRPGTAPAPSPAGPGIIASLMQGILQSLAPAERDGLCQIAHVPYLSPEIAASLTGSAGMFERMVAAGVPLLRTAASRWEMPGPVTGYLAGLAPLAPQAAGAAAAIYRRDGSVASAIRMLLDSGHDEQAVSLLADLEPAEAEDLGWAEIRNAVEDLPASAVRRQPRVLLNLARTAETGYRMDVRRKAMTLLSRLPDDGLAGSDAVRREILAEQARDLMWDERTHAQAWSLACSVIAAANEQELVARARALDVLGRLRSWSSDDGPHDDAAELLEESARLARRLGHPIWAARALVPLAMGVHFGLCRYQRALTTLDQSMVLFPARGRFLASILTFRSTVLCELGRYTEAATAVAGVHELAAALGEEWLFAYAWWCEAELASLTGDREHTVRAVHAVHQHRAAWFDEIPGVEFLAQAADLLDRVGEQDLAAEHLRQARERSSGLERVVRVHESAVLGRSGDPSVAAEVIGATLARGDLDPQERWPLLLLRAYAALRAGDPAAGRLAALAFDTCLQLGIPEAPLRREAGACAALLPLAAAAGSQAAATLLGRGGKIRVSLLGGFELRRGGLRLQPPPGRPATAIRAVAAAGGRMHAEELIEALWPDTAPSTGRNRLKNLLSRLRAAVGDVLVRDGEVIALAAGSESDAGSFSDQARQAVSARAAGDHLHAATLARAAVERYRGDLLPEDPYASWAAEARERLRLQYLELLDLLAARAEAVGEADEAARLVQRAIDAEPYDEQRYLRLAVLFAEQGRSGSARAVLRRARAMLDELGITPSVALVAAEGSLGSRPAAPGAVSV